MIDKPASEAKISCRGVWKIFGPHAERIKDDLEAGATRAQVLEETGHVLAVRDVSFDVREGETFVVMGLSGSGKSTLVRCVSRLIEPTAGAILVDGEDVVGMSDKQLTELRRHKMSMVFQHFGLFPHRRVIDNIAYGLEIQGIAKAARMKKAGEVLELVGLSGWDRHYPHQLSGGMRQRVVIAIALACGPELVIADEPTTALDVTIQAQILQLINDLQRDLGMSVILITHDLGVIAETCDEVCVMYAGRIVERASAKEVFANPRHAYTQGLLNSIPRLNGTPKTELNSIDGMVPALKDLKPGCRFAPRSGRQHMEAELMERLPIKEIEPGHWVEDCPQCTKA